MFLLYYRIAEVDAVNPLFADFAVRPSDLDPAEAAVLVV